MIGGDARRFLWLGVICLGVAVSVPLSYNSYGGPQEKAARSLAPPLPPYNHEPPHGRLPQVVDPQNFGDPVTQNAYAVAKRIRSTLYQLPCYCGCDKTDRHKSLLDCFVDLHGATCRICQQEAIYAYQQCRHIKGINQIRRGIIRGKWSVVNPGKVIPLQGDRKGS